MSGVMIVTGGSRGIGAATCRLAARAGYAVCVNYQASAAAAEALVAEIEGAGGRAIAVQGDMARVWTTSPGCSRPATPNWAGFTALVANAGIVGTGGRLDQADPGHDPRRGRTERAGPDLFLPGGGPRACRPSRAASGGGIVTLSSMAAFLGAARRVHLVRRLQGRGRELHGRAVARGRRRRHPGQCRGAGPDRDRHPRLGRRCRAGSSA